MLQEDNRYVLFFNPLETEFTAHWNKVPYVLQGREKKYFPKWLADHIASKIADHILNLRKLPTDFRCADPTNPNYDFDRTRLLSQCVIQEDQDMTADDSLQAEIDLMNKNLKLKSDNSQASNGLPWCSSCDSKGGRHKKGCPNDRKNDVSEFEGLRA